MMKMAEALNPRVKRFALVTQCDWRALFRPRFDFFSWYGIQRPFRIIRLPLLKRQSSPIIEETVFERFDRLAPRYAWLAGADLVYTRSARQAEQCVRLRLPVILESHMHAGEWGMPFLRTIANSPFLRGVVTISPVLKEMYVEAKVPEEKILVAYDAVDLARFQFRIPTEELRSRLGLSLGRPLAVYCGHLYENRGVDTIVTVAQMLSEVDFLFVGGWEKDVDSWKERTQGISNVRFIGFVPNLKVPEYLSVADLLLMPYSSKCSAAGWLSPMKLFEYMAAQRPIIASALPPFDPILRHGENAWLVPPDSPSALAQAIDYLLQQPALRESLARKAYRDVQDHTWDKRVERIWKYFGLAPG